MRYFDLHCDTLYKAVTNNTGLNVSDYEVSISKGKHFSSWHQCFAIWIPDDESDSFAMDLFMKASRLIKKEALVHGMPLSDLNASHSMIFTVENGSILCNNLNRIKLLSDCGVRMMTLTWNAENCIGGGADAPRKGLTEFGKLCIPLLEENGIVIDVSHSSDKTFFYTVELTTKPIVASHSNSRRICSHRRNLTDEQFSIIAKSGGLVGLNFHKEFLNNNHDVSSIKDVLNHTEHFLSLGGENTLCVGSDFDGSTIPSDLNSIDKIPILYDSFLKIGYNEQLVQKIMYYNAYYFFSRF